MGKYLLYSCPYMFYIQCTRLRDIDIGNMTVEIARDVCVPFLAEWSPSFIIVNASVMLIISKYERTKILTS
jgi:hypothetical protein